MIERKTYTLRPNTDTVPAPELALVEVLWVTREGVEYRIVQNHSPGNREVSHYPGRGGLTFLVKGAGPLSQAEKIDVIYKS